MTTPAARMTKQAAAAMYLLKLAKENILYNETGV